MKKKKKKRLKKQNRQLQQEIAERKRVEETLQKRQEQLAFIIDGIPELIAYIDSKLRYIWVNKSYAAWYGHPEKEFSGRHRNEFVNEHTSQKILQYYQMVLQGQQVSFEYIVPDKEGRPQTVSVRLIPHIDEEGHVKAFVELVQAITGHRQAEEKIRWLAKFPGDNPNPVLRADKDGALLYANESSLPFITLWESQIGHPLPAHICQVISDVLDSGVSKSIEVICENRLYSLTFAPVIESGYVNIYGLDITERKQTEEALRAERDKAQYYLDIAGVIFIVISADGTVKLINQKGCDVLGYRQDEILGKNWFETFVPDQIREHLKSMFNTLIAGEIEPFEYVENAILTKNGEQRLIAWHNTVLKDETGTITATLSSGEDITERKQMEEALQKAKEAAEAANRAKSAFLANMSHELRTPLNAILGYAQILKRHDEVAELSEVQQELDTIERSGNHLLNLIESILDLSKIEAHKLELNELPVAFPGFLRSIADMIQIRTRQKGIAFHFEPAPDLPAIIIGDEQRLSQILLNLLSNAVKFTDQGSVVFVVSYVTKWSDVKERLTVDFVPNYERIRFEIKDTGIGISEALLEKIYSPFVQVGDQAHKMEGAGLGLTVSRQLVQLMGGKLHVKSTAGKGSTFWFELEFPEATELAETQPLRVKQIIGYTWKYVRPIRLLVVDDDWENRKFMVKLLTPIGFDVLEAEDGRDCLTKAEVFQPDLILMDLVMPVMNGYEAIQHIRASANLDQTKVVIISAKSVESPQETLLESRADDFLSKPIQIQNLFDILAKQLRLEWLYKKEPDTEEVSKVLGESPIVPPSREVVQKLLQSTKRGEIEELQEQAKLLKTGDPQFAAFGAKLEKLARKSQVSSIEKFLQHYLVTPITPPSQEDLSEIYRLAEIGAFTDIQEWVKKLETKNPQCALFGVKILYFAHHFMYKELQQFLQQYMQ